MNARNLGQAARAPKREDGTFAYVRTHTSWGRITQSLVYARTLAEAKSTYGWTRENHATIAVRRATTHDVATLGEHQ